MKIAICDDELSEISITNAYINKYIQERGLDIDILTFSDAQSMLEYDTTDIDIYILDVIMPEMNGIELGRRIHEKNKEAVIIYLTTSKEFSISAFSVRAFSYLLKPIDKVQLFAELDECLEKVRKPMRRLMIKTSDGTINLSIKDIMVIEYSDHRLIYHLANDYIVEGLYQKLPFDKQAAVFVESELFVKISASHLVNMENVKMITASDFVMKDGTKYKITRKYADSKKKYIEFAMRN